MKTLVDYLIKANENFPGNCAIEIEHLSIFYHELYRNSCKIAGWIKKFHTLSNVLICLPKSFNLYYAIFGALLSGNCYVPVNYLSPQERFKFILMDSKSKIMISTIKILSESFPDFKFNSKLRNNCAVIAIIYENKIEELQLLEEILCGQEFLCDEYLASENDPCYLLYTSGSTGYPKGILHTHRSACSFVEWASNNLKLTERDVIAHKSNVCFDLSVFDVFATVKVAAKLVPIPENFFNNGALLINFVYQKKITILYSVPSTLLGYLTDNNLQKIKHSSLRHIVFAGEQLYTQYLTKLHENLPIGCQLHNWYGPTETNVCSFFDITKESIVTNRIISIGTPCDFSELSVDENNVLLIKSRGMMESYWGKPKAASVYYTGDIVSINNEGKYFFEGRVDRQVKFRGYRVQLEEIESIANSFFGVNESAAVINKEIILFVVINEAYSGNNDLLSFCKKHLEAYMLPTIVLHLNEIPRTERGKTNYAQLLELVKV